MIKVVIVDDSSDLREGLQIALKEHDDEFICIGAFSDAESAVKNVETLLPDVILMDINLPGISGIEAVKKIKRSLPKTDIIMLTVFAEDKTVFDSLCAGACGYITKNTTPEQILDAIRDVSKGGSPMSPRIARMVVGSFRNFIVSSLTEREQEVLTLLSKGNSYKMVAELLFISHDTVRFHIKNIYKKLEVHSLPEAFAKVKKFG
ncbi:MAG: response regulator transcription factor [Bacteroidetes bacterium]|nr:response regulator transcription factor [Bacteroidota bacterium]MBK7570340.1 response regulator transcription factor [Bacteroidota bacterium]MBK8363623.1 response regulator transcription factor [Bacteroidota bacterium]MBK9414607.1 response regulator transcription factor [Bacteroidota bacterium]MBL0031259.1 response regulator transcription factor [Bacteroidota bacterium]